MYRDAGQSLIDGNNPYVLGIRESNYPPGQFCVYAAIIYFFGAKEISFRIVIIVVHWINSFMVYKLAQLIIARFQDFSKKNPNVLENIEMYSARDVNTKIPIIARIDLEKYKNVPLQVMLLFMVIPPERLRVFDGENDSFAIFFLILFMMHFIKEKYILAGIFCALSLLMKLTTLLLLPLLFIYFIKSKNKKELFKFFTAVILVTFIFFLPFLIDNFEKTITGIGSLTHEPTTIANHFKLWPGYTELHETFVRIWIFEFSIWFFIQTTVYILIIIFLSYKIKGNNLDFLYLSMILVLFSIPILTHSFGIRYYAWSCPLLCIYMILNKDIKLLIPFLLFYIFTLFYYQYDNYVAALIVGVPLNLFLFAYILNKIKDYPNKLPKYSG